MTKKYDIAAYVWPAYTGTEERTLMFWPEQNGEWETVKNAKAKFSGHTWPRKPLWGYVDEADPRVMEMEIDAAADHGVNVFIYDWYWYDQRPFLEQCLNDGYLKARNNDRVKFYLMWANHDFNNICNINLSDKHLDTVIWNGFLGNSEFVEMAARLIDKYFVLPNYYRIDHKPVFEIYDIPNFVKGFANLEEAKAALDWFRMKAVEKGLEGIHLQATVWSDDALNISGIDGNKSIPLREILAVLGFDSITHYQFVHYANVRQGYLSVLEDTLKEWKRVEQQYSLPYFPHLSMGWDNNPRYRMLKEDILTGNTKENVKKGLQMAKAYADNHPDQVPLITINSWNEWTEGSYLQPDDVNGYDYLEAVREVFLRDEQIL